MDMQQHIIADAISGHFQMEDSHYACYGKSAIGGRKENQDCCGLSFGNDDGYVVATVCDGMGGAAGGAVASAEAVRTIMECLKGKASADVNLEGSISFAVKEANKAIYQKASNDMELLGMGSTATVMLMDSSAAYVAHVGDSRIYQIRDGKKVFRTNDHSRVFELVKAKIINEEQARTHIQSNIITRALGIRPDVEVETHKLSYKKGDRFVLCCDGVWNCMPEERLLKIFSQKGTPEMMVEDLMYRVNEEGIKAGGNHDNNTIVVIDVKENSRYQLSLFQRIFKAGRK